MLRPWLAGNEQAGRIDGLLRVESSRDALPAMRATLDALGLPADYVQAVDADGGDTGGRVRKGLH